jgi:hypothetical protein
LDRLPGNTARRIPVFQATATRVPKYFALCIEPGHFGASTGRKNDRLAQPDI